MNLCAIQSGKPEAEMFLCLFAYPLADPGKTPGFLPFLRFFRSRPERAIAPIEPEKMYPPVPSAMPVSGDFWLELERLAELDAEEDGCEEAEVCPAGLLSELPASGVWPDSSGRPRAFAMDSETCSPR